MDPSPTAFGLPLPLAVGLFYLVVLLRGGATYALGRGARTGAGRTRVRARLETPRFRRAERIVERYGAPVVAVSFLTVGFQTLANLAAGALRMPLPAYLPALAVGGFAWALIWGVVGVATYEAVVALAARSPLEAGLFVALLVGALVVIEVLTVRRARRRDERAALAAAGPEPTPAVASDAAPAPAAAPDSTAPEHDRSRAGRRTPAPGPEPRPST
ncbi:VTT domain-containing protein [Microcella daejeonensis]|uniref:DedA family protein n=1 Tax=Microcella daejeonensis TaxID=2994971 RepID=UPI002271FCC1|nr:VTT domain-containing protein [Microcella daejeonensis]WAB84655.1 VTT domain-containing protein [Microcella daejeonensis]